MDVKIFLLILNETKGDENFAYSIMNKQRNENKEIQRKVAKEKLKIVSEEKIDIKPVIMDKYMFTL